MTTDHAMFQTALKRVSSSGFAATSAAIPATRFSLLQATFVTAVIALLLLSPPAAHAGRSCEARPTTTQTVERGLALAEKTLASLNASGADVVLIARNGQDLGKYGVRYSHMGIAYRIAASGDSPATWRVLHKLNDCGTSSAALYRQGLGEFFLDDLWRFEAAWIAPSPDVQARLLAVVRDRRAAVALNHKPYSIVSYAWGQKYQQSNQWVIETLASAMEPAIDSRVKAQAWLQFKGYEPAVLRLGPLTRLGGRMTAANVAFDDHPNEKRFSDRIETVTVDSVFNWLPRAQLVLPGVAPVVVRL